MHSFNQVKLYDRKFCRLRKVLMMNILDVTYEKNFSTSKILASFLDRPQRGPIKSVLLVIIGWLVNWLVTRFSQKRLSRFF